MTLDGVRATDAPATEISMRVGREVSRLRKQYQHYIVPLGQTTVSPPSVFLPSTGNVGIEKSHYPRLRNRTTSIAPPQAAKIIANGTNAAVGGGSVRTDVGRSRNAR